MLSQWVSSLQAQVAKIRREIEAINLEALGKSRAPGDSNYLNERLRNISTKLEPLQAELQALNLKLREYSRNLDGKERLAWRLDRQTRFREKQRIGSSRDNIRGVYQDMADACSAMAELLAEAGRPTTKDITELISEGVSQSEEVAESRHEATVLLEAVPDGPMIRPPPQPVVNVPWQAMILFLWVGIHYLSRKGRKP